MRRIAHLDMDAFFASVELLRYPQLRGLPVVIGGGPGREDRAMLHTPEMPADGPPGQLHELRVDQFTRLRHYSGRGVVTTATYAARAFGIGSAMGLMKAAVLCPDAILLPVDFELYRRYSRAFKEVIHKRCTVVQELGVDEVYIDFTAEVGGQINGGADLAAQLQREIFELTGLSCSIGVAPNKLLARMASEFNKPGGISVLHEDELQGKIWPLSVRRLHGIGPKAQSKLHSLGIRTIGQLAARNEATLVAHFGRSYGAWLARSAWGVDDSAVVQSSAPISLSRETTFARDMHALRDKAQLGQLFTQLCVRLAADLLSRGYAGKTIGVKVKYADFKTATRACTIAQPVYTASALRAIAGVALRRMPLQQRIRLLGVRVGNLVPIATVAPCADTQR